MSVADLAKGMFFGEIVVNDVEDFLPKLVLTREFQVELYHVMWQAPSLSPLSLSFLSFFLFFFQYYRKHRGPLRTLLTEPVKFDKEKKGAVKKLQ